jgi:tryptophanyl-tRNA synthetase
LFTLLQAVSSAETLQYFNEQYDQCTIRYGDLKKQLAEDLVNFTAPIYDRILSLKTNDDYLRKVLREGQEKARESAKKTVKNVREIVGIVPL